MAKTFIHIIPVSFWETYTTMKKIKNGNMNKVNWKLLRMKLSIWWFLLQHGWKRSINWLFSEMNLLLLSSTNTILILINLFLFANLRVFVRFQPAIVTFFNYFASLLLASYFVSKICPCASRVYNFGLTIFLRNEIQSHRLILLLQLDCFYKIRLKNWINLLDFRVPYWNNSVKLENYHRSALSNFGQPILIISTIELGCCLFSAKLSL